LNEIDEAELEADKKKEEEKKEAEKPKQVNIFFPPCIIFLIISLAYEYANPLID